MMPAKMLAVGTVNMVEQVNFACNLAQYISFWVPPPNFGRHTSYIVHQQVFGDRRRRMRGVQTSQLPQFDSIPPIRRCGPTFDLSVRSNFPPSSSFSPRRHPRREQGNSSSQTNETNCISSEQERRRRRRPNGITKPDTAAVVSEQGRASLHI